jgi:ubiquinone/menaquinone biosynthesis C-methylase UbiE
MIGFLANFISKTPIYPHWLEFKRLDQLVDKLVAELSGQVLEVGAGESKLKKRACAQNTKIEKYIATDYSSWDDKFQAGEQMANSSNLIDRLHLRTAREPLDVVCSAFDLPFADASFDSHVSMEVLEHLSDPRRYFQESSRVLKSGGIAVFTVPFLFRLHPDFDSDFFRPLPAGIAAMVQPLGLKLEKVVSNTGAGTASSYLFNQWLIRVFMESKWPKVLRWTLLIPMPLIFACTNLFGWLIDKIRMDSRFASHFLIVLRKTG